MTSSTAPTFWRGLQSRLQRLVAGDWLLFNHDHSSTAKGGPLAGGTGAFALSGVITAPTLTASVNDLAPTGGSTSAVWRIAANAATWTITGIAGGTSGRLLVLHNVGSFVITLSRQDASSAVGNRVDMPALAGLVIGVGDVATLQYDATSSLWRVIGTGRVPYGTGANTVCQGNDSRLSDARAPTAHAASHQNGGADEIGVAGLSGLLADAQTPLGHNASHKSGGADEIDVTGLLGLLNDPQNPKTHASSHKNGGADEIATATAAANAIPKADSTGVLAPGWLPFQSGIATLSGGSVTVSATYAVSGSCSIVLTRAAVGPRAGELYAAPTDIVDGVSFVIHSIVGALDTGTVWWQVWKTA